MRLLAVRITCLLGLSIAVSESAHAEFVELSKEQIGNWSVEQLEDQIDGTKRWLAVADGGPEKGALIFKCDGGEYREVYLTIFFPGYMGGNRDERELTWRVDKQEPHTGTFEYKARTANYLKYASVYDIAVALRDGQTFRARGVTYDFGREDVVVPVSGAREALKKVYQGCGSKRWKD